MKNLVIMGKGTNDYIVKDDEELWTVGTHPFAGADLYFEFHGLPVSHDENKVIREIPEAVKILDLPFNNSICVMLAIAWIKGYKKIKVIGCPMVFKDEYITQARAVAYVVCFLNGRKLKVEWDGMPQNTKYGF